MTHPAVRAILWDVGGPIDTEVISERLWDEHIREALVDAGLAATAEDVHAASERAVASFAPDAYSAMVWDLTGGDLRTAERVMAAVAARGPERHATRGGIEVRPGISELLRRLHVRGLLLGLAANQPVRALDDLDALGLGPLFTHREMSGHHGLRKPDVRLFLRACDDLGVTPAECIMVGDRIDNDIAPAKWLGMRAVLLRTGRHSNQQPRSWHERPDAEAVDVSGLEAALVSLIST